MVINQLIASQTVHELLADSTTFMDFIGDSISVLLRSERQFLICSKEKIPPMLFRKDDDGIRVAFLSEL